MRRLESLWIMGRESIQRTRMAVLVGDSMMYGMASPMLLIIMPNLPLMSLSA